PSARAARRSAAGGCRARARAPRAGGCRADTRAPPRTAPSRTSGRRASPRRARATAGTGCRIHSQVPAPSPLFTPAARPHRTRPELATVTGCVPAVLTQRPQTALGLFAVGWPPQAASNRRPPVPGARAVDPAGNPDGGAAGRREGLDAGLEEPRRDRSGAGGRGRSAARGGRPVLGA